MKKDPLKTLFTLIPRSLNSFDLRSCCSESRKRYTLELLLMYLEEGQRVLEVFLLGGGQCLAWEESLPGLR